MAKVIDLTNSDGDLVVLGRALVLPNSTTDSQPHPLNGSLRFNPTLGIAQLFFAGAWADLGANSSVSSGSGSSTVSATTIAQITGLQNILNAKAPLIHIHALADVTGLTSALANKSDISHTHTEDQITGLQSDLDSKAALVHSHNYTVKDMISASFPASPTANYALVYTASLPLHFPINFTGSYVSVNVLPAALYTITILKNRTTSVGSIIINPNGAITLNLPATLDLIAGDTLTFQCPARDTTIDTISFSLVGSRDPQITT